MDTRQAVFNDLGAVEHSFFTPVYDGIINYGRQHRHTLEQMHEYKKRYIGDFAANPRWKKAFAGREEYA